MSKQDDINRYYDRQDSEPDTQGIDFTVQRYPPPEKKPVKRAVALKYDAEKGTAPIITAVGKGLVADKIIEVAAQSGIAQVEDEFQANALSSFNAGSKVPKFLYDLVAEVLLFVEEADIKNQSGGALH